MTIDQERISIQHERIDACGTLLEYLHEDVPWSEQQPLWGLLKTLQEKFEDEMQDALTP